MTLNDLERRSHVVNADAPMQHICAVAKLLVRL